MATDRLINSSQGSDMIAELITIATNISQINKNIDLGANKVTSMTGYTLQSDASNITTSDTLNQAVSKLEKRVEDNKNNISYNTKNGVSNVLPLNTVYKRGVHADVTEPSKIHFYGTPDSSGTLPGLTKRIKFTEGAYIITVDTDFDTSINADIYIYDMTSSTTIITLDTSGTYEFTANPAHEYLYAFYFNWGVTVDFNYQVTVRPKNSPDVGFQPYALSNAELTNNISLLETKANTNASILSQTYNSADCNISIYLCQDNGAINYSTYYMTDQSKMQFAVRYFGRLVRYWKDGVDYQKFRWSSVGLIATNNSAKKDMLTLDIPEVANETYVKIFHPTDDFPMDDPDGVYTWRKGSSNVGDIWYIRPHIEYTDLETGMEYTMYGAVYKVTVGVPCTIECDTLSCTELTNYILTKIGASDYATQTTGGTVRVWTTTDGTNTILHISNEAPTP